MPKPRDPSDRDPAEVPRADVEHLIAQVLHEQSCGDVDDNPASAADDRRGHAWNAREICAELERRGWTVNRRR
ncbi:hypothetical protein ABT369_38730 [Dactylosporangium sp. NPDC000244]|uniref:hypothetical protein n=1 Tax=Dactylosporangium sp. NPDC000244 TaxID=3154365 RepID=UPI00332856BF